MPEMTIDDLNRAIEQTRAIANICFKFGEANGHTAAKSQLRALEKELAERQQ